jgi:hypothetical protein
MNAVLGNFAVSVRVAEGQYHGTEQPRQREVA